MKVQIFAIFAALCLSSVFSQTCGNSATLSVRADNYVTVTLIHNGMPGTPTVLSEPPLANYWANTYTVNFLSLDQGDVIKIDVTNVGGPGGMKASLNFDGYVTNSKAGNTDFSVNCAQSSGITGCTSSGFFNANDYATVVGGVYGPGTDSLPLDSQWIWTGADGSNPEYGNVVFNIGINCTPFVQTTITCGYQYWEFLALGYPWYHRAALDSWCGPYPSVYGQTTNCYNGAQQIAPACIETFPNFGSIVAGDSSVDWNKRCFLNCQVSGG